MLEKVELVGHSHVESALSAIVKNTAPDSATFNKTPVYQRSQIPQSVVHNAAKHAIAKLALTQLAGPAPGPIPEIPVKSLVPSGRLCALVDRSINGVAQQNTGDFVKSTNWQSTATDDTKPLYHHIRPLTPIGNQLRTFDAYCKKSDGAADASR